MCAANDLNETQENRLHRKMEVGCLRHPGASTVGSQLLDGDCSHGGQISTGSNPATSLEAPSHRVNSGKEGGKWGDVQP